MRKLLEDEGYFSKFVWTGAFWHWLPISDHKNSLLFLVQGGCLSHGKLYACFYVKGGRSEHPSHLLCLKSLQFKIINNPKQHILGWQFWTLNSSKIYILFRIDHILGQKFDTYKKMQLMQSVASDYSVVKIRNLLQKDIWKTSHIWKLTDF